jgi:type IX secretion system substrate protein
LIIIFCATTLSAQWVQVTNGLPDFAPTTLCSFADTVFLSTYGGGIYKTIDKGENWIDISGTLSNLYVNDIRFSGIQYIIYVSTEEGPFLYYYDGLGNFDYADCNGTGLTNTEVTFWYGGTGGITQDGVVGTRGGGFFAAEYTPPFTYDWAPANTGLTGDALFVNDGLVGDTSTFLATDGGFFQALGDETEWTAKNNGLSGDALKINSICWYGITLIATDGGLYYTIDAESWTAFLPDEKFNVTICVNTNISSTGFMCFALGEKGFSTEDFITWTEMDFGGMEGEVTAAQADATNLYIGFTTDKKDNRASGGMYRRSLDQFIVGLDDHSELGAGFELHQNIPNPFQKVTKISYALKNPGFVRLEVFDIYGKKVQSLVNSKQEIGLHSIDFKSGNLSEGIYFYRLQVGSEFSATKKMLVQ